MQRKIPRMVTSAAGAALLVLAFAARADEAADAVLQKAQKAAMEIRALEADMEISQTGAGNDIKFNGTVRIMKPNYGQIRLAGPMGNNQVIMSDGKKVYRLNEPRKQYLTQDVEPGHLAFGGSYSPLGMLLLPDGFKAAGEARLGDKETVNGKTYRVVNVTSAEAPEERKYYVAPNGLIEGSQVTIKNGNSRVLITGWLKNVKLNPALKAEQFAYKPPADYALFKQPPPPNYEANLIAVGKPAPDFLLPQPGGGQLSLEKTLKGKKAVLINFWFHG